MRPQRPSSHRERTERHAPIIRRALWIAAVSALVLGACSSGTDDTVVPEPETVEDCDGLVVVGTQLVRAYVRVLEEVRVDDFTDEDIPPEFLELERIGDDLDARVVRLDCDPEDLNTRINEEVGDLTSESPMAEILLQLVGGGIISTPSSQVPTTIPDGATSTTVP